MRERGGGIPQIVVVDDDPNALDRVARLVERRFGADYAVTAVRTAERALELVTEIEAGSDDVCMILAGYRMPETSGIELLRRCATIAPDARRVVLVGFGELNVARKEILKAAAIGEVDTYLQAPMVEPDEAFYRNVAALLEEWHRIHRPQFEQVRVVGDRWDANVHRIVDSLERSSIHVGFYDAATDAGRELLTAAAVDGELPIVMTWDGRWVSRPSQAQLADLLGVNDDPRGRTFDVIIVGAGPAGLAAAVYAASEGLHVLVVETEALGGQASTSSLIRNYLGFPRGLTGSDLTTRAYWQSWFFGAEFFFGRAAVSLRRNGDVYEMTLDDETVVRGKTVVLTSGVAYRRLGIESIEQFVGRGVFYGAPVTEAAGLLGDHVVVVGGGNSSAQSALYLARYASQVTLIVRRAQLDEMSAYLIEDIEARRNIDVRFNTVLTGATGDGRLGALMVHDNATGADDVIECAAAFILIGAEPRTEWLPRDVERDSRGYVVTGLDYQTSLPGVFAAGDVRLGGMKRVAAAVGDGSSAIRFVHEYLAQLRGS